MMFKIRPRCRDNQHVVRGDRRRAQRHEVGWTSRYAVLDPARPWFCSASDGRPCHLRDVSLGGAGLEVASPEIGTGNRVVLDLPLGPRGATIALNGEVRHTTPRDDGSVIAGIEFIEVGDLERALLLRLVRDLGAAAPQTV